MRAHRHRPSCSVTKRRTAAWLGYTPWCDRARSRGSARVRRQAAGQARQHLAEFVARRPTVEAVDHQRHAAALRSERASRHPAHQPGEPGLGARKGIGEIGEPPLDLRGRRARDPPRVGRIAAAGERNGQTPDRARHRAATSSGSRARSCPCRAGRATRHSDPRRRAGPRGSARRAARRARRIRGVVVVPDRQPRTRRSPKDRE